MSFWSKTTTVWFNIGQQGVETVLTILLSYHMRRSYDQKTISAFSHHWPWSLTFQHPNGSGAVKRQSRNIFFFIWIKSDYLRQSYGEKKLFQHFRDFRILNLSFDLSRSKLLRGDKETVEEHFCLYLIINLIVVCRLAGSRIETTGKRLIERCWPTIHRLLRNLIHINYVIKYTFQRCNFTFTPGLKLIFSTNLSHHRLL